MMIAILTVGGLFATWSTDNSTPTADAGEPPVQIGSTPAAELPIASPAQSPVNARPAPFASDDRGFIDSAARCGGAAPAHAIGRTQGSLVVICGSDPGQYEYLGVRLSDAAVLRTHAQTDSTRSFLAQKSGVVYAVSPTELRVTSGDTVIKREPMIEYREVSQ